MKIFKISRKKSCDVLNVCGIKIKFHERKKLRRRVKMLEGTVEYYGFQIQKIMNMLWDDRFSSSEKKHIIEKRFMIWGNQYFPNIDNPRSFNEKIQWLNLYYHNPLITVCTDKILFKDYLAKVIDDSFIVPTLGVYNDANEIDFSKLPEEFVLKSNWGGDSQQVILVNKNTDIMQLKRVANSWLLPNENLYYYAFNWGYKNIKPKLIAEEMLKPKNNRLYDYKFMCFNGEPKIAFVVYDRREHMTLDFFDMSWNKLDFKRKYENAKVTASKPKNFDKMKDLCKKLSKPFPFVRIDFYEVDGKLYIGEFTFTPGGGFEPFSPVEWDYKLGDMLKLPNKIIEE